MSKCKKIKNRIPEGEAILDQIEFTMEDYSDACKKMSHEYNRLINFIFDLGLKYSSKVLEIGPGPGWIGIWLAKKNTTLEITGLELSQDMIRVANNNKELEGVADQVMYVNGNAESMKMFSDNSFDAVISNGSLHHWNRPEKVFNEIKRVVKNNGIFCICDGRRDLSLGAKCIFHIVKQFIPKFMKIGWKTSIMAGYTLDELKIILDQSDLKDKYELKLGLFDFLIHNN